VFASQSFAGRERSLETLLDNLCHREAYLREFRRPTRAVLGEAYLLAKTNIFKALIYLLKSFQQTELEELIKDLDEALERVIYRKLSEELLFNVVSSAHNSAQVKRSAANLLLPIWEDPNDIPMHGFTKLLLSAWRARCRVRETFGTLVGVHEVFSLLRADCDSAFLEYFTRDRVSIDEGEAFREFLFGLSFEDLTKLRDTMDSKGLNVVGPSEVWSILGRPPPRPESNWTAETVYVSYRRRRLRADYRVLSQSSGPRKTAEGYLMGYHLSQNPESQEAAPSRIEKTPESTPPKGGRR